MCFVIFQVWDDHQQTWYVQILTITFLFYFILFYIHTINIVEHFRYDEEFRFKRARLEDLPWTAFCACMGLGFSLSLLFFMDQNISAAMVNNPCNKYVTIENICYWVIMHRSINKAFLSLSLSLSLSFILIESIDWRKAVPTISIYLLSAF